MLVLGYILRCLLEQRGEKGKGVIALREAEKRGGKAHNHLSNSLNAIVCRLIIALRHVRGSTAGRADALAFLRASIVDSALKGSSVPRSSIPP